jgi:type I restriction enzyme, S subunit
MRDRISNIASGTSGSMKNISKADFLSLTVPIPPMIEQQHIVEILEFCDREIDGFVDITRLLQQQKRGLMQQLLTGALRVAVDEE